MLSPKQEKFCLQYASSGNVSASYMMAGYRVRDMNTASAAATRLLKKPQIQDRLRELAQEVRDDRIADIKECQEILTRIARNEDAEDSNRIKAVQLLLKVQGAFTTNINVNATVPVVISGGDQLED